MTNHLDQKTALLQVVNIAIELTERNEARFNATDLLAAGLPELVNKDGAVDYDQMTAILWAAVKELSTQVEYLNAQFAD